MDRMKMNTVQKLISIIIIGVNVLSVTSKFLAIQNNDPPTAWFTGMFTVFNNEFAVMINDESDLTNLFGKPPIKDETIIKNVTGKMRDQNLCPGYVHSCWLKTEKNSKFRDFGDNMYFCLCNRTHNNVTTANDTTWSFMYQSFFHYPPPALLDSFCVDPIVLEKNWVITGVRFRRYENRIHLEVQKAKLNNGRIYSGSTRWHIQRNCVKSKKIFTRNNDSTYDHLKIVLNDFLLPEDAVLTGVTFGESIVGRYVNDNGNIHRTKPPINQTMNCPGTNSILKNFDDILPSTAYIGNNTELSRPCKDHIIFHTTSFDYDFQKHIVPYVDLREIVTEPIDIIHGIGWYYRGAPRHGGFLSLRIYTKDYFNK